METKKKSIITPMTMTLYSGREVDIFNLKINDIDIEDSAHALSLICRYGGHCLFHYSVAQHSVLCSYEPGTPKEQLEFLIHDCSETYVHDLVRPIKHRPEFLQYRLEEDKIQKIIFEKYGLEFPLSEKVHKVDNKILRQEIKAIIITQEEIQNKSAELETSFREARKILRDEKMTICHIKKMSPEEAEQLFLNRFYELYNQIK